MLLRIGSLSIGLIVPPFDGFGCYPPISHLDSSGYQQSFTGRAPFPPPPSHQSRGPGIPAGGRRAAGTREGEGGKGPNRAAAPDPGYRPGRWEGEGGCERAAENGTPFRFAARPFAPLFLHVLRNSWLKFAPGIPGTNFRQGFLGNPWRKFAPRFLAHLCAEDPWRIPGANLRPEFLEMLGANLRQGFLRNSWRKFAPRILVVLRARLRGRFARVPRALGISTVDFVWVNRPLKILR